MTRTLQQLVKNYDDGKCELSDLEAFLMFEVSNHFPVVEREGLADWCKYQLYIRSIPK